MLPAVSQPVVIGVGAIALPFIFIPLLRLPRGGEVSREPWPPGDALFHLALGIMSVGLLGLPGAARHALPKIAPFDSSRVLLELACAAASVMAVSPLLAIVGMRTRRRPGELPAVPEPLSAPPPPVRRADAVRIGLTRFALALIPFQVFEWSVLTALILFNNPAPAQPPLVDFYQSAWPERLAMIVSIAIAAPIAEETIFRGTLQPALARVAGPDLARLATAVIFGALHGPIAGVPIGILGYFLGRIRDAWGSLLPCIAIHAANNLIALFLFAEIPFVRELYQ